MVKVIIRLNSLYHIYHQITNLLKHRQNASKTDELNYSREELRVFEINPMFMI